MVSGRVILPKSPARRGPKTARGKLHASLNAQKYVFSDFRFNSDQDARYCSAIKAKLIKEADDELRGLNLDAIATAIIKAYRIRSENAAVTLNLLRSLSISINSSIDPDLKHLEGLRRYECRARSRLATLTRSQNDRAGLRFADVIRRIIPDQRSAL